MFNEQVVRSDAFLDMPAGSQLLYFHLGISADDDGFVGNPRTIMRMLGSTEDEYKILVAKKFVLVFENGICVIKHWRINNYIRKQIYKETKYQKERGLIYIRENGAYSFNSDGSVPLPKGHFTVKDDIQNDYVDTTSTQRRPRLDKISIDKISIDTYIPQKRFTPPTVEEVRDYCKERENSIDPDHFVDHYTSNGWRVGGKTAMKDWKASVRTWEKNNRLSTKVVPKNVLRNDDLNARIERLKAK